MFYKLPSINYHKDQHGKALFYLKQILRYNPRKKKFFKVCIFLILPFH